MAILQQDAAHERSEPTADYRPRKDPAAAPTEEEPPAAAAGAKPPKKGAAPVEEPPEVVLARRAERKSDLAELSGWNKGMDD